MRSQVEAAVSAMRGQVLRSLAALSSAISFFRAGSTLPGSATPLVGAPVEGRATRRPGSEGLRRSLRASVAEGIVAELFTACAGATVLTGWALALGLGPFQVGSISALPFLAQFVQFPAAWLTLALGYRRVALVAVCLSRLVMMPLALMPWLPLERTDQQWLLVAIAAASALLGVVGNNAWVQWMGELVPERLRGRFFGKRTALCTLGGTLASLAAGVLLDRLRPPSGVGPALPLLAALACVAGVVTTLLMARQHDPRPARPDEEAQGGLKEALLPLRHESTRRVLAYQVAWNAAVGLSAPFYAFHSLQNLHLGFALMAAHAAATAGVRVLTAPLWGRTLDRVGAQPVLLGCSLGIAVIPAVWLLPEPDLLWPLAVDALLAGMLWSGHSLAAFALPLSVAPRRSRPYSLAAFATAGGLAYAAASALGGGLASQLPTAFTLGGHAFVNLHVLFALSSLARVGAALLALRIVEPQAQPVRSLGALVELLRPRRLAGVQTR